MCERAKILVRIDRLAVGNFGDCKSLGGGLFELRIDWGPGFRVYYGFVESHCILLLCGGDKRKQSSDRARGNISTTFGKELMRRKPSKSHDEGVVRELRNDPGLAAAYLKEALEDTNEPAVLLIALRRVAEGRGGIAKIAKAAGVERESLYRALSTKGNPRLSTLFAVVKAVGLRLTLEAQ
jgi:putative addiction module killer protein/probable addiction module antidote protein